MSKKKDIERDLDEMAYELNGDGPVSVPVSEPANYTFVDDPALDAQALEEQLNGYDFTLIDTIAEERDDGAFWYKTDLVTDHFKKVGIRASTDSVSVFPKNSELPDLYELVRIIHAIEAAFGSELTFRGASDD